MESTRPWSNGMLPSFERTEPTINCDRPIFNAFRRSSNCYRPSFNACLTSRSAGFRSPRRRRPVPRQRQPVPHPRRLVPGRRQPVAWRRPSGPPPSAEGPLPDVPGSPEGWFGIFHRQTWVGASTLRYGRVIGSSAVAHTRIADPEVQPCVMARSHLAAGRVVRGDADSGLAVGVWASGGRMTRTKTRAHRGIHPRCATGMRACTSRCRRLQI
jgi:hypothetical protein